MSKSNSGARFDGAALRRAREAVGLTRAQLAERLGTEEQVVKQWEEEATRPLPKNLPRVAEAVSLPVADLWRPESGRLALADLRAMAGVNQSDLADSVGLSRAAISKIELGKAPLRPDLAPRWAKALGVGEEDVRAAAPEPVKAPPSGLHVVIAQRMEYERGELVRASQDPVAVFSPQGGAAASNTMEGALRLLAETLNRFALENPGRGAPESFVHQEIRFSLDGEPVFALRHQVIPAGGDRETLLGALGSLLVPQWAPPSAGEDDPAVKTALLRDLYDHLPASKAGVGRLLVVATPTDTHGWLLGQVEPGQSATAVFEEPGPPLEICFVSHAGDALKTNARRPDSAEAAIVWTDAEKLGITPDSTLRQVIEAFGNSR